MTMCIVGIILWLLAYAGPRLAPALASRPSAAEHGCVFSELSPTFLNTQFLLFKAHCWHPLGWRLKTQHPLHHESADSSGRRLRLTSLWTLTALALYLSYNT